MEPEVWGKANEAFSVLKDSTNNDDNAAGTISNILRVAAAECIHHNVAISVIDTLL